MAFAQKGARSKWLAIKWRALKMLCAQKGVRLKGRVLKKERACKSKQSVNETILSNFLTLCMTLKYMNTSM